jgi:AraC family transcriptional activator of pobA
MKLSITDFKTGATLNLVRCEANFYRSSFTREKGKRFFTIAWNTGCKQHITIDGILYDFDPDAILTLTSNQAFSFERPVDIVAWQFNREFYCVAGHGAETGCRDVLFVSHEISFIRLIGPYKYKLKLLMDAFTEELQTMDQLQNEMVMVLLKRLMVLLSRLALANDLRVGKNGDSRTELFRKYSLLVELNFKTAHSVNYYAGLLNKSPKTLANIFAPYNGETPVQVIQSRIMLEAKRLLSSTNRPVKQISYELGFDDPAHFSNFFKRHTQLTPGSFRSQPEERIINKRTLQVA